MKSLGIAIVSSIFIIAYLVPGNTADKTCKATVQELTKANMAVVSQCAKSMKFKNGKEKSKKQNCIMRCALIKAGVTNPDGQVSVDTLENLFSKYEVPPEMVEKANRSFFPCIEMGINEPFKTLEEDEFCLTYKPFVTCFMQRIGTICD